MEEERIQPSQGRASGYRTRGKLAGLAVIVLLAAQTGFGCATDSGPSAEIDAVRGIEVTVLSRGRGVPVQAASTFARIKSRLQQEQEAGHLVGIDERIIGLEGERRLCALFAERQRADQLFQELTTISEGIDLLSVSRAPCTGL